MINTFAHFNIKTYLCRRKEKRVLKNSLFKTKWGALIIRAENIPFEPAT